MNDKIYFYTLNSKSELMETVIFLNAYRRIRLRILGETWQEKERIIGGMEMMGSEMKTKNGKMNYGKENE